MLFYTHLLFGLAVFVFARNFFSLGLESSWYSEYLFLALLLLGSILPDLDAENSKINQAGGVIGWLIAAFSKHRGFLHSLIFGFILFAVISLLWSNYYAWGLFLGYLTHLFGDSITKMGTELFYPFSEKRFHGPIKAGGWIEGLIAVILLVLIIKIIF